MAQLTSSKIIWNKINQIMGKEKITNILPLQPKQNTSPYGQWKQIEALADQFQHNSNKGTPPHPQPTRKQHKVELNRNLMEFENKYKTHAKGKFTTNPIDAQITLQE